jgi:hypothetical protein
MSVLFENEENAVRTALMGVSNSQIEPQEGDPRNLDPDDLAEMMSAASALAQAADDLHNAVRYECIRRERILNEMTNEAYLAWAAEVEQAKDPQ